MVNQSEKSGENSIIFRPPVVVVLGHVDHGKSSILEAIKDLKITAKESGGITQHIGAYEVEHTLVNSEQAKKITFIDTPGHEAFSAIRGRGAKVADIAVLVVAADEGVKEQTKEAISHIKKWELPLIVAINKIDKPQADPPKIKRELAKENILVEEMGGKIPSVLVSAIKKEGISELLEMILLMAEMENLKADISKSAEGVIIESYMDSLRGPVATLILNEGILKTGDIIGTSSSSGKIKSLENFQGIAIEKALPAMPAVITGFEKAPKVGEEFKVFSDLESANSHFQKEEERVAQVFSIEEGQKVCNIILKADVLGSVEAIEEVLRELPQEKIVLRILKSEVGDISESDVKLAQSAKARVLGFRVKINSIAQNLAEREKINVRVFEIIYELVEGIRKMMEKIVEPELVKTVIGKIKILAIFRTDKSRQILGGKTTEGEARKGGLVEILRNEEKIGQGKIINLQRNKKDAEKTVKGDDCGMLYEGDARVEEGDVLAVFTQEMIKGEL